MANNIIDCEKMADNLCNSLERWCEENDGEMLDFFEDGSIYGEDADGGLIVGYGVCGSANLVIYKDCVRIGGYSSKEFSPRLKRGISNLKEILSNC